MRTLAMRKLKPSHHVPEPTPEDLERIKKLLHRVGGDQVSWGAEDALNIWVIEQRVKLDQQMSKRIQVSSWSLVVATVGLVACTAGLIGATLSA